MRPELSIILPCLNEESTISQTLERTIAVCHTLDITWEIIVVDNGSTDRSKELVGKFEEVRLVECQNKGYGNALRCGLNTAQGNFLVFFDSDLSYHPEELPRLLEQRRNADMVMGSRLQGRIERGAMPWLHRYIGTPLLTMILNLFFSTHTTDCNSGYRLFTSKAYHRLQLQSEGMEFVSEITIKSALLHLSIIEVPITYSKDQRIGRSHLRTFRDGWRHLRLMLMYTPFHAFAVPGLFFVIAGSLLILLQLPVVRDFIGYTYGFHVAILGGACFFIGLQLLFFYFCTHLLTYNTELFPKERWFPRLVYIMQKPVIIALSVIFFTIGFFVNLDVALFWIGNHFGSMDRGFQAIFGFQLMTLGIQLGFSSLFTSFISFSRSSGHLQ